MCLQLDSTTLAALLGGIIAGGFALTASWLTSRTGIKAIKIKQKQEEHEKKLARLEVLYDHLSHLMSCAVVGVSIIDKALKKEKILLTIPGNASDSQKSIIRIVKFYFPELDNSLQDYINSVPLYTNSIGEVESILLPSFEGFDSLNKWKKSLTEFITVVHNFRLAVDSLGRKLSKSDF